MLVLGHIVRTSICDIVCTSVHGHIVTMSSCYVVLTLVCGHSVTWRRGDQEMKSSWHHVFAGLWHNGGCLHSWPTAIAVLSVVDHPILLCRRQPPPSSPWRHLWPILRPARHMQPVSLLTVPHIALHHSTLGAACQKPPELILWPTEQTMGI